MNEVVFVLICESVDYSSEIIIPVFLAYYFHNTLIYSCSAHRKGIQLITIVEGFDRIEKKLDRMNRLKDCLDGDTLLDNCDLAQLLGVTQRTIARYREKGLIRYYQTDENGKNFYRSSEIREFLQQKGKKKS